MNRTATKTSKKAKRLLASRTRSSESGTLFRKWWIQSWLRFKPRLEREVHAKPQFRQKSTTLKIYSKLSERKSSNAEKARFTTKPKHMLS